MKNLRKKKNSRKAVDGSQEDDNTSVRNPYSDVEAAKDVDLLKSMKVDEKSMETIMEKIKLTTSYRKKMMKDLSIDLLETFPYFFTHPKLVSLRSLTIYP